MGHETREQAAGLLAAKLGGYKGRQPLILGIPRGAVPMAKIIADALAGEVDVVLVRKLGAPGRPELAIGAIDETGHAHLSDLVEQLSVTEQYIEAEKQRQLDVLRRQRAAYTPLRRSIDPAGRVVIVVDDGIATGATMIAALRALRSKRPGRLIAAVAVAPPSTLPRLAEEADEVACLQSPEFFYAVGQFFADFSQVSDAEVAAILQESRPPIRYR